jgi:hypothetical protein
VFFALDFKTREGFWKLNDSGSKLFRLEVYVIKVLLVLKTKHFKYKKSLTTFIK